MPLLTAEICLVLNNNIIKITWIMVVRESGPLPLKLPYAISL